MRHRGLRHQLLIFVDTFGIKRFSQPRECKASVLFADEPVNNPKRQHSYAEPQKLTAIRGGEVENDQFPEDCEHREQYDGSHMNDARMMLSHNNQGTIEFECNNNRKDHSEYGLEY